MDISAGIPMLIAASGTIVIMIFPIWRFIVRVKRYRHRVTIIGLVGSISWMGFGVFFTTVFMLQVAHWPVNGACSINPTSYFARTFYTICLVLLYSHFITKAQLMNRDGRMVTKIQILSYLLVLATPVVGFLMLSTGRHVLVGDRCHTITNPATVISQALLHIACSAMPTISFMEQTCDLLMGLPKVERIVKETRPFSNRARLIYLVIFTPGIFLGAKGSASRTTRAEASGVASQVNSGAHLRSETRTRAVTMTTTVTRSRSNASESHTKIIRLVRRVLLATVYSSLTTVIIYAVILSGVLALGSQVLYGLDGAISWCWAIYASPLPQEVGSHNLLVTAPSARQDTSTISRASNGRSGAVVDVAPWELEDKLPDKAEIKDHMGQVEKTVEIVEPAGRSDV